jgi:Spy/CpxP family protein refolding chaperone
LKADRRLQVVIVNKNVMYIAVFGVLCVLAGVAAGAVVARNIIQPFPGPGMPGFGERAERFIGHGPRPHGNKRGGEGPIDMFTEKLKLNTEQREKVSVILEKTRQEIDEVGRNVRSSMLSIKEKGDKQIMDILTPRQKDKFKELLKDFDGGPRPGHEPGPGPEPGFEDGPPNG